MAAAVVGVLCSGTVWGRAIGSGRSSNVWRAAVDGSLAKSVDEALVDEERHSGDEALSADEMRRVLSEPAPACDGSCDSGCGGCGGCDDSTWRLFPPMPCDLSVTGWVAVGATGNADNPASNSFFPVGMNDRAEAQMNQLYLVMERTVDTQCQCFDIGGRADVLYGTDARYVEVAGLELRRDGTDKWNTERFYRIAAPQMYAEFALCDLSVKIGHWYTVIGYEQTTAPDNFFYSRSYALLYGEPFAHTGVLGTWACSDQVTYIAGVHSGWDTFDRFSERAGFIGGVNWRSRDERTSLAFAITSGHEFNARGRYTNR